HIPIFPLELVLYPHQRLHLHIFEERYKEMVNRCLDRSDPFGVINVNEGKMADIGCLAEITRILAKYEDGRMDLQVTGRERFRVLDLYYIEPYVTAEVERIV